LLSTGTFLSHLEKQQGKNRFELSFIGKSLFAHFSKRIISHLEKQQGKNPQLVLMVVLFAQ